MVGTLRVWWLRFLRTWKLTLFTSIFATILGGAFQKLDLMDIGEAERQAYDDGLSIMTDLLVDVEKSEDVIILAIDDLTIQAVAENQSYALNFGAWPYSRNVWARVVEHLANDQAKAVVFDAVIDERHPDPSGDLAMGEIVATAGVPFYVGFNVSQSQSTKPLPKVEAKNRKPSAKKKQEEEEEEEASDEEETFPEEEEFPEEDGEEFPPDEFPEGEGGEEFGDEGDGYPTATREEIAGALAFPVATSGLELTSLADGEGNMRHPQPPIAPLIPGTAGFGLVLMEEDEDGKLRKTRFAYSDGINSYVTLPVAVVADVLGVEQLKLSPSRLVLGGKTIEINEDGSAEINYGGELDQRFQTVSLIHVLDDWAYESQKAADAAKVKDLKRKLAKGYFKDKIVVIGGFALGTADVKATPFAATTPGVVKQATEIQNLLDGRFIIEAPFWSSLLISFLMAWFSMALIVIFRSNLLEVVWPVLLFTGFFVVTGWLLVTYQLHVLSAMPAWAASFVSVVGAIFNHVFTAKERERLKEAFSGAVDDTLLDQMVEEKVIPKLSGETREVTAVITDINNFSELAARFEADPGGLAKLLNRYHTELTEVLLSHGGYVDKYLGDTIVCLFGAPLTEQDHALRACRAAEAVVKVGDRLQKDLPGLEGPFHTRVGVSSAKMFVGNFGSDQKVDYTAVGDEMRVASRIERENENQGTRVLLSQRTVDLCGSKIEVRPTANLELLEGEPPQTVYELVDVR